MKRNRSCIITKSDEFSYSWSQEMLRPTFPGMLRSIRKNFFNLVLIVDPTDIASKAILKLAESFYVHRAPVRIGLVFKVELTFHNQEW